MDRISLQAQERNIVGKKVKHLRKEGLIPAHVYGYKTDSEPVTVSAKDFIAAYDQAGETGLIDLKIGQEKVRPVLIREVQYNPLRNDLIHVDFYQVNLKEKVRVYVPIELVGDEPESVHMGEAVVLQNLAEVEVEALPTDLIEKIEVNIAPLKNIDDAITVENLSYDRSTITVLAEPEEVVVKLAPAITEEMKALMAEQEAEAAAAAEAEEGAEGEKAEGEEAEVEGEAPTEGGEEAPAETGEQEKAEE